MIISYAQNFEDVMLWRALKSIDAGFYIDAGANDPSIDSVTKLFYEKGWNGINIEPLSIHFERLQQERPRDINLLSALGSAQGEIELWHCDVRGWATADQAVIAKHIEAGHVGKRTKVPMTTLTALCERYAPADIHFLKIDVEGFERPVLEGMDFERFRPWIVVVEATSPDSTDEVYDRWAPLLLASRYRFVYADGLNRFYLAIEQAELAEAFKYPPNFFDHFVKAPLIEDNIWAQTLVNREAQAKQSAVLADAKALQAEQRATLAETRAVQAEAALSLAETHRLQAEEHLASSETRTRQAEDSAAHAKASMIQAEQRATLAETCIAQAEKNIALAEACTLQAEKRAALAENCILQVEKRAVLAEASLHQTEALRAIAEARALHAEQCATQANAYIETLKQSTSWRITSPLRLLKTMLEALIIRVDTLTKRDRLRRGEFIRPGRLKPPLLFRKNVMPPVSSEPMAHPSIRSSISHRPRLAYISPLPPEHSGIADYSAELIPYLADHYEIDVIIAQFELSAPWVIAHCGVRTSEWFIRNAQHYDRVLYHFGNSSYHSHMFKLLAQVPGAVVLHDFYLGDIYYYIEMQGISPHALTQAIYRSHGYRALVERLQTRPITEVVRQYPANLEVLQQAVRIIVHSEYSRSLANDWYGPHFSDDWAVIPLLRTSRLPHPSPLPEGEGDSTGRSLARSKLGFKPKDFIVCSFGLIGASKLNRRLLDAWLNSRLAQDDCCILLFVGEAPEGAYVDEIKQTIQNSGLAQRIRITGWTDRDAFKNYLDIADIAVQLRTLSRGETSAAVLDCMNHRLPTIVNAHGSFVELPADAVWMLPDLFEDSQLIEALETLWMDEEKRIDLGRRAEAVVINHHAPNSCARRYAFAIEQTYARLEDRNKPDNRHGASANPDKKEACARRFPHPGPLPEGEGDSRCSLGDFHGNDASTSPRQLLIDVSATCRNDLKTGIQRVVRALVWELIQSEPPGFRVEPVYLTDEEGFWQYRYARKWTCRALDLTLDCLSDEPSEFNRGDRLLIADFTAGFAVEAAKAGVFERLKNKGVRLDFFVYDLLPMQRPEFFPPGQFGFSEWLDSMTGVADSALCISQSVAEDLKSWMETAGPRREPALRIDWFHLGADIENSMPSLGLSEDAESVLARLNAIPSFLMVGTVEPRKGYKQTLDAFTQLWREGLDINLVIVGKEGWIGVQEAMRRTIPETIDQLRHHPELGKRLLWLEGVSDEYLEKIYAASACLIAASEGEGFGLPLIEAAQNKLPIIARDLPIFREVAGEHAFYFEGLEAEQLAQAIRDWLKLKKLGQHPVSYSMPWLTWKQSARSLIDKLESSA